MPSLAVVTLALAGCVMTCANAGRSPEEEFQYLFLGYTLFRAGEIADDTTLQYGLTELRAHRSSNTRLTPGHGYAFRKSNDWQNATIAVSMLPQRLRAIGARVTKAPMSEQDLIYAVLGGPFFRIEFEKDGHVGTIFNRLVRDEAEGPAGTEILIATFTVTH